MANVPANPAATALGSVAALKAHLTQAAAHVPATGQSGVLQFTKHGDWVFGAEKTEVTPDDLFAVNPSSFVTGYICWAKDEKQWKNGPIDEVSVPLGQTTPLKHELKQHEGGDWQEMSGFSFRFTEGQFKGKEGKFTTTSRGGMTAVRGLMDALIARLDTDDVLIVPVVSPGADFYIHKTWGKTWTPVLDIEDWADMNGQAADEPDEQEAAKPVEKETAKPAEAAKEPEPVAADPAPATEPARRRRRG